MNKYGDMQSRGERQPFRIPFRPVLLAAGPGMSNYGPTSFFRFTALAATAIGRPGHRILCHLITTAIRPGLGSRAFMYELRTSVNYALEGLLAIFVEMSGLYLE